MTRRDAEPIPETPERLFRLLKPTDPQIKFPWSHQADILRRYDAEAREAPDVAIELPTGAGKTLVGLLLGDFRRRSYGDRVAYLCPTIQLARQVAERAADYGITAHALTGSWRAWPGAEYNAYVRAQAILVSSYWTLFNTRPHINDVQTLILDDAHSAEDPIASLWSLRVGREDEMYAAVSDIVGDLLPPAFATRLRDPETHPRDRDRLEIIGPGGLASREAQLRDALAAHAESGDVSFSISMVQDHIRACFLYINWNELLIRPVIAPTSTHRAFEQARQRIYMSATLGEGGELERSVGMHPIRRLPVPEGWAEHGAGRRFFMFPSLSIEPGAIEGFVRSAIESAGRALVLAPSASQRARVVDGCTPSGFDVLGAEDLEADSDVLAARDRAVLALANRYDGMDFPNDTCRLIVLSGLPGRTNLQERFMYEKLGSERLLAERIRAKLVQGSGRCTRNPQDYAAVIVHGPDIAGFLARKENVQSLQPELQAEIEFGLRNAEEGVGEPIDYLEAFLAQTSDWQNADEDIKALTGSNARMEAPSADQMANAAPFEIEAWRAAWTGDFARAIEQANRVVDELEGGDVLRPYRCFWLFTAASWAQGVAHDKASRDRATRMMDTALACAGHLAWRPYLTTGHHVVADQAVSERSRRAAAELERLGQRGRNFERFADVLLQRLRGRTATPYELALLDIGTLLGFEALRPGSSAAPDSIWRDGDAAWLIFEAKSEALATTSVSPTVARQAAGHKAWVETETGWPQPVYSATYVVTDQTHIERSARAFAGATLAPDLAVIESLAEAMLSAYRTVRNQAVGAAVETWPALFEVAFTHHGLDTDTLATKLAARALRELPERG